MNCLFWVLYGMPFVHPGSILVLTANGIGLAINLGYILIFLLYATDNKRRALFGLISGLVIGLAHNVLARTAIIGGFGYLFSAMMYFPRIMHWVPVCRKKSVEDLPAFPVVVTSTLNNLCWLIYASIRFDVILWFTYCVGFTVGVVQLILLRVYDKKTSKIAEAQAQLRGIGIDDHEKLAADEVQVQVQVQKMDTCDDKKVATSEVQLQGIVTV
ncbi:Bidirectional sugar transporter SWEET [Heracleum sosnowskyi]|uniref:Bidirectional sugar transporter SWEET n=1 Tax=Heracleum sosnowskyi TaxID=360622 RepID=A0AAD8IS11_9APIA|nr:Bidirectional sugar transporter SWEET [Heracleum sosnowskyi]